MSGPEETCSAQSVDLLEAKIKALELRVFGADLTKSQDESVCETVDVVDSLIKSQTIMGTAVSSHEKIGKMVKRMDELDAALDPSYETNVLNNTAKIQMLLLMYDELYDMLGELRRLKESADILNSDQIRAITKVEDRLTDLANIMQDSKTKVESHNEAVHNMLTNYNKLINSFTRTFAQFDEILTELEIASDIKKNVE